MNSRIIIGWTEEIFIDFAREVIADVYGPQEPSEIFVSERSEELLLAAESGEFDLAILMINNIMLPGLGSWTERWPQLLEFLSTLHSRYQIPIVALAGSVPVEVENLNEIGVEFFYHAPVSLDVLRKAIQHCSLCTRCV